MRSNIKVMANADVHDRPLNSRPSSSTATFTSKKNQHNAKGKSTQKEESDEERRIVRFLAWLQAHGARFDKIDWPSYRFGVRGAVALADIDTEEDIASVPEHLLLTPLVLLENPEIGHVFEENLTEYSDEDMLAVLLMHERGKGEASFFFPYLDTLPQLPDSLMGWDDEALAELQDEDLCMQVHMRRSQMAAHYTRLVEDGLKANWPHLFGANPAENDEKDKQMPSPFHSSYSPFSSCSDDDNSDKEEEENDDGDDPYSFKNFAFAWQTIQARAFGRRLRYSALVPFCDGFNHANVAIKYRLEAGVSNAGVGSCRTNICSSSSSSNDGGVVEHAEAKKQQQQQQQQQHGKGSQGEDRINLPRFSTRAFHLFPSRENRYKKGEEVFTSYGRRTNGELLLSYGFSLLDNEHECVNLPMTGIPFPPSWFCASLARLGINSSSSSSSSGKKIEADDVFKASHALAAGATEIKLELLAYFRSLVACRNFKDKDEEDVGRTIDFLRPFPSVLHEAEALGALQAQVEGALAAFPTTLEEDEVALKECMTGAAGGGGGEEAEGGGGGGREGGSVNANCRMAALTYRLTRKRILRHHLVMVQKEIRALEE